MNKKKIVKLLTKSLVSLGLAGILILGNTSVSAFASSDTTATATVNENKVDSKIAVEKKYKNTLKIKNAYSTSDSFMCGNVIAAGSKLDLVTEAEGKGKLKYRFAVLKDGKNVYTRGYKSSNEAAWTPSEDGNYTIYYKVKDSTGKEVSKSEDENSKLVRDYCGLGDVKPTAIDGESFLVEISQDYSVIVLAKSKDNKYNAVYPRDIANGVYDVINHYDSSDYKLDCIKKDIANAKQISDATVTLIANDEISIPDNSLTFEVNNDSVYGQKVCNYIFGNYTFDMIPKAIDGKDFEVQIDKDYNVIVYAVSKDNSKYIVYPKNEAEGLYADK